MDRAGRNFLSRTKLSVSAIAAVVVATIVMFAGTSVIAQQSSSDLSDLSLEELMSIQVTSVSKRAENIAEAPAAVFVLTADEILRSGATSIPEALRMVPGLEVAQMSSNSFAVTARGFNGTYANKLLVMVDGRSVYTPLYSGVFWDMQDAVLEDIDRIEVVRGPGATLWGANAVNGVINIITKPSSKTRSTFARISGGSIDRNAIELRHGAALSEESSIRLFGRRFEQEALSDSSGANSGLRTEYLHGGFRFDASSGNKSQFAVQGDMYDGKTALDWVLPILEAPYVMFGSSRGDVSGHNLLANWQHDFSPSLTGTLQYYYDHSSRSDPIIIESRNTHDIDYQQDWVASHRTRIMWGAGFRASSDVVSHSNIAVLDPAARTANLWSGFLQGEFKVVPGRVSVTVGSKFEHDNFTGAEIQPSGRVMWTPNSRNSIWGSVSRAVRTPSRGERDGSVWLGVIPPLSLANPTPVPMKIKYVGNSQFASENLLAYELGYRTQPSTSLWCDIATFYNKYDNLIGSAFGLPYAEDSLGAVLVLPFSPNNDAKANLYGVEIAADWKPSTHMSFRTAYTFMKSELKRSAVTDISLGRVMCPQNQLSIRSSFSPSRSVNLDLWGRYVDRLPDTNIHSYITLDARIGVMIGKSVEAAIIGKDLLEKSHIEFTSEILGSRLWVERRIIGSLAWRF